MLCCCRSRRRRRCHAAVHTAYPPPKRRKAQLWELNAAWPACLRAQKEVGPTNEEYKAVAEARGALFFDCSEGGSLLHCF